MNNFVYFILGVSKNGQVAIYSITRNWRSNLCDIARSLSLEHEDYRYMVVQFYLLKLSSYKVVYIFKRGKLISYVGA